MREILFRGKLAERFADVVKMRPDLTIKDNFIYGSLITCGDKCFICISAYASHKFCVNNSDATMFEVDPETVGQYTGLTDKNGVKIFEGDIVTLPGEDNPCEIVWNDTEAKFEFKSFDITADFDNYWAQELEVIANKYDYDDPNCWEEW